MKRLRTVAVLWLTLASVVMSPVAIAHAETIRIGTWLATDNWETRWAPQLDYCTAQTGVHLEYVHIPHAQYSERLLMLEIVGDTPDLLLIPPERVAAIVNAGLLEDVQPLIQRDAVNQSAWFPGAVEAMKFQGITFGVPAYVVNYTYAYNIDLFAERGLVAPAVDEWLTWEQVYENARKATTLDADGIPDVWGFYNGLNFVQVLAFVRQAGGEVYTDDGYVQFNSQPVIDAVHFTLDLLNNRLHATAPALFTENRLASMRIGSGSTSFQRSEQTTLNFGTAAGIMNKDRSDVMYVTSWSLPKLSANPEAAWRYMQCVVSPESQRLATERGVVPMRRDTDISERRIEMLAGLLNNVAYSKSYPHHVENEYVQTIFDTAIKGVWNGTQAPEPLFESLDTSINGYLQQSMNE